MWFGLVHFRSVQSHVIDFLVKMVYEILNFKEGLTAKIQARFVEIKISVNLTILNQDTVMAS
jgi:hypothetical protein